MSPIFILFCFLLFLAVTLFSGMGGGSHSGSLVVLAVASLPLVPPSLCEPGLTWQSHGVLPLCRRDGGWPLRPGLKRHRSSLPCSVEDHPPQIPRPSHPALPLPIPSPQKV